MLCMSLRSCGHQQWSRSRCFSLPCSDSPKNQRKSKQMKAKRTLFINEEDDSTDRDVVLTKDLTLQPVVHFQGGKCSGSLNYTNYLITTTIIFQLQEIMRKCKKENDLTILSLSHAPALKFGFHSTSNMQCMTQFKWLQWHIYLELNLVNKKLWV